MFRQGTVQQLVKTLGLCFPWSGSSPNRIRYSKGGVARRMCGQWRQNSPCQWVPQPRPAGRPSPLYRSRCPVQCGLSQLHSTSQPSSSTPDAGPGSKSRSTVVTHSSGVSSLSAPAHACGLQYSVPKSPLLLCEQSLYQISGFSGRQTD